MDLMFDDRHVTGAESAIPGEIPLDKEEVTIDDDSDSAEDDEEVIKAKPKKQRKTKSCKDDFSALDEKNPFVRMYKKASDAICVTAESIKEASSSSKAHPPPSPPVAPAPPPPVGPSMNEAMEMAHCGGGVIAAGTGMGVGAVGEGQEGKQVWGSDDELTAI
uniref:Uncharacterized protein n=1 Tax=Aegilops tauschii TaxID=37682 RepID=N1R1M3_AEGTA